MHVTPSLEIEADAYFAFNVINSVSTENLIVSITRPKTSNFNKLGIYSHVFRVKAYDKVALVVI